MINLLLCGNGKVFDGALTELISITNRTKEAIRCYIFTAKLTRIKPEYTAISEEQIEFLDKVIKRKNSENQVVRIDVTEIYEKQFKNCANEGAYCTPYTLLRLLIDEIPNIPDKILYLDIDMMIGDDISKLYNNCRKINSKKHIQEAGGSPARSRHCKRGALDYAHA